MYICREEKSLPQSKNKQYLLHSVVSCRRVARVPLELLCFAGTENISEHLKEQISPFRHMLIYSEVCLIGHRYYSVKKVRLLNSSALSSAVCYWTQMFFCEKYVHSYKFCCLLGETDQTYTSKSEKMEAPSII